jgi:CRISPR-associated protein Csx10
MNAVLSLTLLSDTLPGSGTSFNSIVDREICFDSYGVPYIPAKRLCGIMLENAEALVKWGLISSSSVDSLFGKESAPAPKSLVLENGMLPNAAKIHRFLQWAEGNDSIATLFSSQNIPPCFSYVRNQTAINDSRIKVRNSLRASRVLRKGLTFEFPITAPDSDKPVLEKICKAVRKLGSSVNRGLGEVRIELKTRNTLFPTVETADAQGQNAQIRRITLEIMNEAPLLVSSRPGASQVSDSFIPGSIVLAALATKFLETGVPARAQDFHDLFLSGKVSFGNLYPFSPGNTSLKFLPAPLSLKKVKNDPQKKASKAYYDIFQINDSDDVLSSVVFKGGAGDYAAFTEAGFCAITPERDITAHHRRPADRSIAHATKDDGAFFQFDTLAAGQHFAGAIEGDSALLDKLYTYLPKDGILRLGKSKNVQYGKCQLRATRVTGTDNGNDEPAQWEDNTPLDLLVASDVILMNSNGFPCPSPEQLRDDLARRLGLGNPAELSITKCFTGVVNTGGFLSIWGLPRVQHHALAAGTVIQLLNKTGKSLAVANALTRPFGIRTEDGFGKVIPYPNGNAAMARESLEGKDDSTTPPEFTQAEVKQMASGVLRRHIAATLAETARQKAAARHPPNNHAIGRLIAILKSGATPAQLQGAINDFKDTARNNLQPIAKDIYISKEKKGTWLSKDWTQEVEAALNNIPEELCAVKSALVADAAAFHAQYALTYLTALKRKNRTGTGERGKYR